MDKDFWKIAAIALFLLVLFIAIGLFRRRTYLEVANLRLPRKGAKANQHRFVVVDDSGWEEGERRIMLLARGEMNVRYILSDFGGAIREQIVITKKGKIGLRLSYGGGMLLGMRRDEEDNADLANNLSDDEQEALADFVSRLRSAINYAA